VVLHAGEPAAWLIAALVAVTGTWAQQSPARHPASLFARGLVLVVGGFMLEGIPATASSLNFVWPLAAVTAYSLLLPRGWVHVLWAASALAFVCALAVSPPAGSAWQAWMLQVAVLGVFAYGAFAFAESVRDGDQAVEATRRDRESRLFNDAGFFSYGGELFDGCKERKRPFSLVLLSSSDLRDVSRLAGRKAANQLFAQLVGRIEAATPPEGLAARSDTNEFAMALPGLPAAKAAALIHQQLGEPPSVEVTLKDRRIRIVLDLVAAEATPDVGSIEDMYDRLRSKLIERGGDAAATQPSEFHSTLQGMWEGDSVIPQNARPTLPMSYADSMPSSPLTQP